MAFEDEELNKRREERRQEQQFLAKQQKFLKIGIIMTAVTLVFCVAAILIANGIINAPPKPELSAPPTTSVAPPTETEPAPTVPDSVIHIVAGGDLNITDKTVSSGTTVSGYDYTDVFLDVVPALSGADLTVLNFEGSIYGAPYGSQNKSAPQQMLLALQQAGVDMLQAANSQTVVNGLSGLASTLQGIRNAGMEPLGAYETAQDFKKSGGYYIREIQGVRVAFVAFTKGMDGMGLPAGNEDCVNLLYKDYNSTYQKVDTDGITEILRAVEAKRPDITVALLHWGSEFNTKISSTQEKICKLMQEEGVDAIIGSHSHYVQTLEYDQESGKLVAYSLGDFFGDADKAGTDYSVLLDLEITKSGATGETKITGFDFTPIYTVNETETGGGMRVLRIREAIAAYESNFIERVSEETYTAMKSALQKIESRMSQN